MCYMTGILPIKKYGTHSALNMFDIISMLTGEKRNVNIRTFSNDMTTFHSKDDVFTLLIHLGYLGYDSADEKIYIPNNEVKNTFVDTIRVSNWGSVTKLFKNSNDLLKD